MTMMLDRTGATTGDFDWMSSRSETSSENQTRPAPITDPNLREALGFLDSLHGEIMAPIYARLATTECTKQNLLSDFVQMTEGTPDLAKSTVMRLLLDDRRALEFSLWVCNSAMSTVGSTQTYEDEAVLTSGDTRIVEVLADMTRRLGLPMEQVLEAADIPSSTYYWWKANPEVQPRLASQRRLWALVQLVEDAEEVVGSSLQQWILSRPERRGLLLAGKFDALLRSAMVVPGLEREYRRDLSIYAVGGEFEESESPAPRVPSRPGRRPGKVRGVTKKSRG